MKGTTTNHAKGWSSSKEGDVVYMVGLEGSPLLWVPSGKPNDQFQQVLLPIRPTESSTQQKHPELVNRKCIIFYRDTTRPHVSLITRQKRLQLDWEVLIHPLYSPDIAPYRFPFISVYKILLIEKISIPWKGIKGTWNSSLLKKIKISERWNYEVTWKMAEDNRTKQWICCSLKILGENEKFVFYFT